SSLRINQATVAAYVARVVAAVGPVRGVICAASLLVSGPARAATITVTTTAEDVSANDPGCSLREAIIAANRGTAKAGCPAGDAGTPDTIVLQAGATYTLTKRDDVDLFRSDRGQCYGPNGLPPIASSIGLEGDRATNGP